MYSCDSPPLGIVLIIAIIETEAIVLCEELSAKTRGENVGVARQSAEDLRRRIDVRMRGRRLQRRGVAIGCHDFGGANQTDEVMGDGSARFEGL